MTTPATNHVICKFCNLEFKRSLIGSHVETNRHKKSAPSELHISGFPETIEDEKIKEFLLKYEKTANFTILKDADGKIEKVKCKFIDPKLIFSIVHQPFLFEDHQLNVTWKNDISQKEEILKKIEKEKTFDDQIKALQKALQPESEQIIKKCVMISCELHIVLEKHWPNVQINIFGSIVTGLYTLNSDLDLYVTSNGNAKTKNSKAFLRSIKSLLFKSGLYSGLFLISNAKVPIIQFTHKKTSIKCDLNVESSLGVQNSKLISYYLSIDDKLKQVMLAIKYSFKCLGCFDSNLTNYALVMMFIFYLQQSPYCLPTVESLQNSDTNFVQQGWNCGFIKKEYIKNDSLANATYFDIFIGFFKFYSNFDFESKAICPFIGKSLDRNQFLDVNKMPDVYKQYKKISNDSLRKLLNIGSGIFIQDPFQHNRNITEHTKEKHVEIFWIVCLLAEKNFNTTCLYRNFLDEVNPERVFYANIKMLQNQEEFIKKNIKEDSVNDWLFSEVKKHFTRIMENVLLCKVTIEKDLDDSTEYLIETTLNYSNIKFTFDIEKDVEKMQNLKNEQHNKLIKTLNYTIKRQFNNVLIYNINKKFEPYEIPFLQKPFDYLKQYFKYFVPTFIEDELSKNDDIKGVNGKSMDKTPLYKIGFFTGTKRKRGRPLKNKEHPVEDLHKDESTEEGKDVPVKEEIVHTEEQVETEKSQEINEKEKAIDKSKEQVTSSNETINKLEKENENIENSETENIKKELEETKTTDKDGSFSQENDNKEVKTELFDVKDESVIEPVEEDVPDDFFDDFSNQDFMAGLDIVDEDEADDNEEDENKNNEIIKKEKENLEKQNNIESSKRESKNKKKTTESHKKKKETVKETKKKSVSNERSKSSSKRRRISCSPRNEKKRQKSSQDSHKHKSSSRNRRMSKSPHDDRKRKELRRDPEKTRRDIHKDKIQKEQKIVSDKLKIVETGLVPPGTEMDVDYDVIKQFSPVESKRRSKSLERRRYTPERRHKRNSSREHRIYSRSRSPDFLRTMEHRSSENRRRRSNSIYDNNSDSNFWSNKKKRSRSKESPTSRKRKYEIAKKKSFLEEIREKLKEIGPTPTYYPPPNSVPQNPIPSTSMPIPMPVPAPPQYYPSQVQYDQNFFIGQSYHPQMMNHNPYPANVPMPQLHVSSNSSSNLQNITPNPSHVKFSVSSSSVNIKVPVVSLEQELEKEKKKEEPKNLADVSNIDQLFAEKKISLSDFLSITAKSEVNSSGPEHLQKKIRVISRCQNALKILTREKQFNGRLKVHQKEKQEKSLIKEEMKYQSPLRNIPVVRLQYTTPLKNNEAQNPFTVALDRVLKSCGLIKDVINLVDDDENTQQSVFTYADEDLGQKVIDNVEKVAASAAATCEECKKRKSLVFADVSTQCLPDNKLTFSVGIQVSEEDFNKIKKKDSLVYLTPAQLLGKDKSKDVERSMENEQQLLHENDQTGENRFPQPLMEVETRPPFRLPIRPNDGRNSGTYEMPYFQVDYNRDIRFEPPPQPPSALTPTQLQLTLEQMRYYYRDENMYQRYGYRF